MNIIEAYQKKVDELLATVRETQMDKIREAGRMMADAMCAKKNIVMWQYTDAGRENGIRTNVDLNLVSTEKFD